jgi:hypothetical protein
MVTLNNEWNTHPTSIAPAAPDIASTPAFIRVPPAMIRPPWVLDNDTSADAVA